MGKGDTHQIDRQDLFSSIFLGTVRVVSYDGFYPSDPSDFRFLDQIGDPPPGFLKVAHQLSAGLLETVAEVGALYASRTKWFGPSGNGEPLECLDSVLARIEGHLHNLRRSATDDLVISCIIATQLCVYGFWDSVWNSPLIPRELSSKLLIHLRCCQDKLTDCGLLMWLIYVGRAFAIDLDVREGLHALWAARNHPVIDSAWPSWIDANSTLYDFVWSDVLYSDAHGWFWQKIRE